MPPPMTEGDVLTVELHPRRPASTSASTAARSSGFSEAISFQIMCADQEEADHYWNRLTEGGEESQCGWLKDRFGVSWQVTPAEMIALLSDPDPAAAQRATQAMLRMRRIDLAEIRRAADSVAA